MDVSKFLGKFRDATRDHLRRMNELLMRLEEDPAKADAVTELMREIHTLKGESRMMGFGDISALSHAIEDLLRAQQDAGFRELSAVTDLLFRAFDDVDKLLREKLSEGPAGVDVDATARALRQAAGVAEPGPEGARDEDDEPEPAELRSMEAMPELPQVAEARDEGLGLGDLDMDGEEADDDGWTPPGEGDADPQAAMREAFGVPQGLAQEIGEGGTVAAPGERAVSLGGGAQRFLARFREHAAQRLAALQGAVEALVRDRRDAQALAAIGSEASALGESARQVGFEDVSRLAHACASLVVGERRALPDEKAAALVEAIETLGRLVAQRLSGEPPAEVDDLIARLEPVDRIHPAAPAKESPEPPRDQPPPATPGAAPRPRVEETIRVSVEKLDRLAMLSTDIYLSHAASETRLRHLRTLIDRSKAQAKAVSHVRSAMPAGGAAAAALVQAQEDLLASSRELSRGLQDLLRAERDELLRTGHSIVELRERVRELQMLPVSTLFDLYPRVVRDLARDLGKQVRLIVEGGDVELDRRVLDEIRDPMVHLLRNAIDHGIEAPDRRRAEGKAPQGTLTLTARAEGDRVVVEVKDDGAGIDAGAIRRVAVARGVLSQDEADSMTDERAVDMIFAPGFSSKETVTDVSGRGVGLDVVRDRVDRLEGTLTVWSQPGRGTRFELRVPLSVAVARLILVRGGGMLLSLPAAVVDEVLRIPESEVSRIEGYEAMHWNDRALPLVSLAGLLEREPEPVDAQHRHVAVVHFEDHAVGLVVDAFAGEREAVVKPLDEFLGRIPHVAGATILTSGEVVTVLHVPQLIAASMGVAPSRLQARIRVGEGPAKARRRRLLVVDDSIIVRDMMKGVLEAAGFDVTLAVDGADGLEKQLAGLFDAVVSDVEMPRMTGFEMVRALRANPSMAKVPIVMVTTLDSHEAREEGLRSGASAYLVKNLLDMSQLVDTIERLVEA